MSDNSFQRFGKYLILDHLVDGGMAKICRARFLGEQANKVVAVKMVQPQFSKDPSFVKMFQDELNVTFSLLHPNIVQVYDYGKVKDQLYTAMEYVDGVNLKQVLDRLKEKNVVFPVEISVYIIAQVCQGLYYAHTFTDKLTGQPLNMVHRDISPHNIMVTYDGAVKVIDFGIAKANTNSEATQAGTIKGKLSYLAPEYLDGLELDHRYDQFAVGITLWELLCSRKLFHAANDLAVLKQIQACKIAPPSSINPNVPKELDAIVMKALSKDRSQRFENMDKFNRALVKFLYSNYPDFNATDLSYFAKELFKEEIKRDKDKFVEFGKIDVTPFIEEMKNEESSNPAAASSKPADVFGPGEQRVERIELDLDLSPQSNEAGGGIELATPVASGATRKVQRATGAAARQSGTGGKTGVMKVSSGATSIRKNPAQDKTSTGVKRVNKNDAEQSSSGPKVAAVLIASFFAFAYIQPELVESMTGFNLHHAIHGEPSRDPSSVPDNNPQPAEQKKVQVAKTGKVALGGVDLTMDVFVNGKKVEYVGLPIEVPLDQSVAIVVKKAGHKAFVKTVMLDKDKIATAITVPELVRAKIGLLNSSMNYAAGSILTFEVDGEKIEKQIPFRDVQIPEGSYQATVVNPVLGTEKKVEFTIEENKIHYLE